MADVGRVAWADFLFQMKGKLVELFPAEGVFLAELHGFRDQTGNYKRISAEDVGDRDIFVGDQVRHTVVLAPLSAGGFVKESSAWNVPHTLQTSKALLNLVRALQPFSITVDVERDSDTIDYSQARVVEELMDQARVAIAKIENIALNGDGTGKVSDITGGSSPGLTLTVGTGANFDILLPGTVWDIRTKSTGALTTGGKTRRIASVSESAGTVTFDTAAFADGDSGNITFSTSEGIYIQNSWSNGTPGNDDAPGALAAQGLEQAAAVTGTFESINKATVQQWQGTDGRGGDTTTAPLSGQMMDGAVRRGRRAGLGAWDFGLGDPAAIDLYKQGLYAQVRYEPQTARLESGYQGIVYDGADRPFPLIKEVHHKKGAIKLIDKASFQVYGDKAGPGFLDDDGAMFRRFARALPKEADLLDRFQLGVSKCNTTVFLNNLAVAS